MFGFTTGHRSTSGEFRRDNQDSLYSSPWSAFVADGVGGHAAGDIASAAVTLRIASTLDATHGLVRTESRLRELIAVGNAELGMRVRHDNALTGMATTFTGIFSDGERIRVAHVGDSRAYLVREGHLTQVTRDHSLVQDLMDAGRLTPELARTHPYRSVVVNVLGGDLEDAEAVQILTERPRPGDRWLLTSDGLTDYVPEEVVSECLSAAARPQDAAELLVNAATVLQARDNVTVVVADVIAHATEPAYEPSFGGSAAASPASSRAF
ncbi:PP2C family protein-serine/threonine phosphatase [Leifsonia poae]|uniref:PP2C family protein-serine/threonine phosphatase n=1 Tax=Leifsonia poae TaxID=110933 RepID=UPI001CBCECD5|nr:protein phosphatase 2C domain-containing protein [Leifsonia poae]